MAYGDWSFEARLFDRRDGYVCDLEALSASWVENLDGEDTVTVSTTQAVAKYDRLVWRDWTGAWHEHVADEPQVSRTGSGVPVYTVAFRTALYDLDACHVAALYKPTAKTAQEVLAHLLSGTRWQVGDCTGLGKASASFYHVSALEAVRAVAETWGGDLRAVVEVGAEGVTARKVALAPRGSDSGRRFDYGRDLVGVTRTVAAGGVYTALYGYGKGEEVGSGYGRRLTFEDVEADGKPKGQAWVGDEDARESWGIPDGAGGVAHRFGCVTFEDCEDAAELLALTRAELEKVKAPQVTLDIDVLAVSDAALDSDGVAVGDTVEFVDGSFAPTLRGTARVTQRTVDLLSRAAVSLTIGDGVEGASDRMREYESRLDSMRVQAATWQAASSAAPSYLRQLLAGVSELSNLGLSYKVESPEIGVMVANVPLDPETGAPTAAAPAAGYSCLRLRAGYIQTSSRYESGAWVWETAIQGGGVVASAITSGTIAGADWWAGKGGSHWDLGAGGALVIDGYATDAEVEEAKKSATGFLQLADGEVTCGNRSGGAFTGTRAVMGADGFRIQDKDGADIAKYGATGETFYDGDGGVVGYASHTSATYQDDGKTVTTNLMTLGGADMAKLAGSVSALLEMSNGKTGTAYKTAHVKCGYPTGNTNETPVVDIYAYGGAKLTEMIVSPDGVQCAAQAVNPATRKWGTTDNDSRITFCKHMGVVVASFSALFTSNMQGIDAGVWSPSITLPTGWRPHALVKSPLICSDGTVLMAYATTAGTISVYTRGSVPEVSANNAVSGQLVWVATS